MLLFVHRTFFCQNKENDIYLSTAKYDKYWICGLPKITNLSVVSGTTLSRMLRATYDSFVQINISGMSCVPFFKSKTKSIK